jgi:hypothetical protein
MWNRKRILRGECAAGVARLWRGPFRPQRLLAAISSNDSLGYGQNPHRRQRHRRQTASAEQQDELPFRSNSAGLLSSLAPDRPTFAIL